MNMFNCFQAVALYTALPFGIQYLMTNGHDVWGYMLCVVQLIGYAIISVAVAES